MNFSFVKKLYAVFFLFLIFLSDISAKKDDESGDEYVPDPNQAVKILVPARKERLYFSSINKKDLALVEKGSPES